MRMALDLFGSARKVPAMQIFSWLHELGQYETLKQARTRLTPPNVVPTAFTDCALKDAWEKQELGLTIVSLHFLFLTS